MGVHFSKSKDGTYAIYSTYTDRFLLKGLSYKEVVFYFLEDKSYFDLYQMFQFAKDTENKTFNNNSLEEADGLDLEKYTWDGIKLFRNPLYIKEDQYIVVDYIYGEVPEENRKVLTEEEAKQYIKEYYLDYYSDSQIDRFIATNKKYGYQDMLQRIIGSRKEIISTIKSLTE